MMRDEIYTTQIQQMLDESFGEDFFEITQPTDVKINDSCAETHFTVKLKRKLIPNESSNQEAEGI